MNPSIAKTLALVSRALDEKAARERRELLRIVEALTLALLLGVKTPRYLH